MSRPGGAGAGNWSVRGGGEVAGVDPHLTGLLVAAMLLGCLTALVLTFLYLRTLQEKRISQVK